MTKCSQHLVGPVRIAKLLDAAKKGHTDCVKKLVKGGANVNGVSKSRLTPLVYAIQNRHEACVLSLLNLGANVNFPDRDLKTPLIHAIDGGSLKTVKILVDAGADVNSRCKEGESVLMYALGNNLTFWTEYIYQEALREKPFEKGRRRLRAGSDECVAMLLAAGADVNTKIKTGRTALMVAAEYDMVGCVEMFLKAGADVNVADNDGNTAASYAVDGNPECLKLLVEAKADVNGFNSRGYNLLMLAKKRNECLKILLKAGADVNAVGEHGQTALFDAVSEGCIDSAKLLVEVGADVNYTNWVLNRRTCLTLAALSGNEGVVKLLTKAGADVNIRGEYGMTALMIAATKTTDSHLGVVKTLIEAGADVNLVDEHGRTALHTAVLNQNISVVEYLLKSGSKVRVKDKIFGHNSLESYFVHATQTTKEMVQLLIAAGETFPKVKAKKTRRNKSGSKIHVRMGSVSVKIPSYLLEDWHSNLQSMCRDVVRNQMLSVSSVNLFARVPRLRERLTDDLPGYLLNNVFLSTTETTPKENDDVNTDNVKIGPAGTTKKDSDDTSYSRAVPENDTRHENNRKVDYDTIEDVDSDENICDRSSATDSSGDGRRVGYQPSDVTKRILALSAHGDGGGGGDTVSRQVRTDAGSVDGDGSGGCCCEGGGGGGKYGCGYEDGGDGCGYEGGGGGSGECRYEGGGGVISIQIVTTFCMYCQQEAEDVDGWVTTESEEDADV